MDFIVWRRFEAYRDRKVDKLFLGGVAEHSEKAFKLGIDSKKTGRIYNRNGRRQQASAPGEYPAVDTGALRASISTRVTSDSVEIGTSPFYARFLRNGTKIMERRKMSDNAIREGVEGARHLLKGWVKWKSR